MSERGLSALKVPRSPCVCAFPRAAMPSLSSNVAPKPESCYAGPSRDATQCRKPKMHAQSLRNKQERREPALGRRQKALSLSLSLEQSLSLFPLSLSFSLSRFWTRNERAPSGVTSEATQHCCENNCHNIPYYDEKLNEDQGKETQVAGQLSSKMKQTVTKQWTNATDILHSVQTKNKLLLCVPSSPLGTQRDFHVSALCVEDPSPPFDATHRSQPSKPTIDANHHSSLSSKAPN